jgi:hypothetical protein
MSLASSKLGRIMGMHWVLMVDRHDARKLVAQ